MFLLQESPPSPIDHLALDEAMVEFAELQEDSGLEILRIWEMPSYCVLLGRGSKVSMEVHRTETESKGVPILRRSSGGATVVGGPGCLMYSVLLSYARRPMLRSLDEAHRLVVGRLRDALSPLLGGGEPQLQGTCDLTWRGLKFSGNALRCKREFLLYHGTILYDFPLDLISRYLLDPPRQPDYRQRRSHRDFVTNVPVDPKSVGRGLIEVWQANSPAPSIPTDLIQRLKTTRYDNPAWHRVYE